MSDWASRPDVMLAGLKRERDAVAQKHYADPELQQRRLTEIDAQLAVYGETPETPAASPVALSSRRERAVVED